MDIEVNEADNVQVALDFLRDAGSPELVLLDIDMPVMDGLSCLRKIREEPELNATVVIMCTSNNSLEKIQEARSCGANEYVMKPFTDDIIREKLVQTGLEDS